jgi:hypothetical protein
LSLRLRLVGHQRGETIERARHLADGVGGDAGVERRRIEAGVTEQNFGFCSWRLDLKPRVIGVSSMDVILCVSSYRDGDP